MKIQFNTPIVNNRGQVIVEPDPTAPGQHRALTIGSIIYALLMEQTGMHDEQRKKYEMACRIDEQLQKDEPEPIEFEPKEVGELQTLIENSRLLATKVKIPAVDLLKDLADGKEPTSEESGDSGGE